MILDTFLRKLNVSSYLDLNEEERETYKKWENSLSGRRITEEEMQDFFASELLDAMGKVIHERAGTRDDLFLKMKIEFITKIQSLLNAPKLEKKMLEKAISAQIDTL